MTRCTLFGLAWLALQVACSTYDSAARPDGEQAQQQPEQRTERKKKPRPKPRPKPEPVAKPESDIAYVDLTRSARKDDPPEVAALRQELFAKFSIDELLTCAKDDAVACPSPVSVRLRVDPDGVVQGVTLKPAKPENKVWLGCLEETYKKIVFQPQPKPTSIKTRFHIDCGSGGAP